MKNFPGFHDLDEEMLRLDEKVIKGRLSLSASH
jgi:hypothetical protein